MGYRLRMHREVRGWLKGLRDTEPELARLIGEAVLALLVAGETLGPPVVVSLESVLRTAEDPREALDLSYQRQLEILTKVRRGVADVATSRKRVELQIAVVEQQAATLAGQCEAAVKAGREDLASQARARETMVREQLSGLRHQLVSLAGEEKKLTAASQRLAAKVDAFRVQKETIKASHTAAEASETVREAIAEIDMRAGDLGGAAAGQDAAPAPPGMMALRPGAPGPVRAALLFVVEPEDTAVLLAHAEHPAAPPGGYATPPGGYEEVITTATGRLAAAQPRLQAAAASPGAFISYNAESFLDAFFPGEEAEVDVGAAALVARNRARTLAEARQRMRLTQAEMAQRMNVRQERVSAIERAEPGATEVRTLAAYVRALGGRLEIIAHIGNDRIILR